LEIVGQVISGSFAEILIRQKYGKKIELGELLIVEFEGGYSILQAYHLEYGSQIPQSRLELMSGIKLEEYKVDLEVMEPEIRTYIIAHVKGLVNVYGKGDTAIPKIPKDLPNFFSNIRRIEKEDLDFLKAVEDPVFLGKVRSGSRTLDVDINLSGNEVFKHHVLIPATTGRGKSNLVKVFTFKNLEQTYCGMLFIDPHDEYYKGLSKHREHIDYLVYYTPKKSLPPGAITLAIHVKELRPWHLNVFSWSQPQIDALYSFYNNDRTKWVINIVDRSFDSSRLNVNQGTLGVLQRKFRNYLGLYHDEVSGNVYSRSIFKTDAGDTTASDIVSRLEEGKKVILDCSILGESTELILNSIIVNKLFESYKRSKLEDKLDELPTIAIVLEEAPRVIGKKVMGDDNIFGTIAREGRKFKIGLIAITQLPSEIPREVLANMNTKIILGNEMGSERRAIIDSASQDLSTDDRTIASLDIGEALISSNFTKFAIPITIPLFDDVVKEHQKNVRKIKKAIPGGS